MGDVGCGMWEVGWRMLDVGCGMLDVEKQVCVFNAGSVVLCEKCCGSLRLNLLAQV